MPKLQTLNECIMASMAITTTGYDQYADDLLEVAIIPMYDLERDKNAKFFTTIIRPEHDDHYVKRIRRAMDSGAGFYEETHVAYANASQFGLAKTKGVEGSFAAQMFDTWFSELPFRRDNRLIVPLCFDWSHIKEFLIEWLGRGTVHSCFDYRVRDFCTIANWENDYCGYRYGTPARYNKTTAGYVFNRLGFEEHHKFTAIERANHQIAAYAEMFRKRSAYEGF